MWNGGQCSALCQGTRSTTPLSIWKVLFSPENENYYGFPHFRARLYILRYSSSKCWLQGRGQEWKTWVAVLEERLPWLFWQLCFLRDQRLFAFCIFVRLQPVGNHFTSPADWDNSAFSMLLGHPLFPHWASTHGGEVGAQWHQSWGEGRKGTSLQESARHPEYTADIFCELSAACTVNFKA